MKEFFARLNPTERRFVVGVGVVFFLVINLVWVWPHFGDWSDTKGKMTAARTRLVTFETGTNLIPDLEKKISFYQGHGQVVPEANQALQFARTVMNQTTLFGIVPQATSTRKEAGATNSFFVEQSETMTLDTTEKQLVDFFYSLGSGSNSLIRVKSLTVMPDPSHQRLSTRVTLVASYQKSAVGSVGATAPAGGQKPAATPAKPATPPSNAKPAPAMPTVNRITATNRSTVPNHPPAVPAGAPKNLTPNKK